MPIPNGEPEQHQRVLLRDMVRERIRDAIMDGTLRPGEDLRDEDLQVWLGVSRTPIRDAVNELTRMGLIEMAPNRYTRVAAAPSDEDALEAFATLGVLFGGAVRLAVPRLTEADRKAIDADFEKLLAAIRVDDLPAVRAVFSPLFERYLEHCGNAQLKKVCADTIDGLQYKVRVERLQPLLNIDAFVSDLEELQAATAEKRAVDAEFATERVFLVGAGG